jgi:ABC-type lipoprotein release transport system permease subunit
MIALAALGAGFALSWAAIEIGGAMLTERTGLILTAQIDPETIAYLAGGVLVIALIAALFPAIRAANTPIEEVLQS